MAVTKSHIETLGNPTPIGLMGLAFGCSALAPMELGLTSPGAKIWLWVLMMGGVMQIWAGIVDLINRNELGATAFTLYGSLWLITGWQMSSGINIGLPAKAFIYIIFLFFTIYMMIGFMTVSLNLTLVFCEFILIFIIEIISSFIPSLHHTTVYIVGVLHTLAMFQVVWAAAGGVLNTRLGKDLFKQGHPPLKAAEERIADDFTSVRKHVELRKQIVGFLYKHWEEKGWEWISTDEMCKILNKKPAELVPDSWYLYQKGYVGLDEEKLRQDPAAPKLVRLTAAGIDYYGQLQQKKFKF